jgi:hypothetical protein
MSIFQILVVVLAVGLFSVALGIGIAAIATANQSERSPAPDAVSAANTSAEQPCALLRPRSDTDTDKGPAR